MIYLLEMTELFIGNSNDVKDITYNMKSIEHITKS